MGFLIINGHYMYTEFQLSICWRKYPKQFNIPVSMSVGVSIRPKRYLWWWVCKLIVDVVSYFKCIQMYFKLSKDHLFCQKCDIVLQGCESMSWNLSQCISDQNSYGILKHRETHTHENNPNPSLDSFRNQVPWFSVPSSCHINLFCNIQH